MMYPTTRTIMPIITSVLISSATELDCHVDISPVLHVDIVSVLRYGCR